MTATANELQHILEEYERVMHGDAWHGDPVWEILDHINASCAAATPVHDVHSIWQLVMHMAYWERMAVKRGSGAVVPDENLNFPPTPAPDEAAWQQTLEDFRNSNREFREHIARLDAAKLDEKTPGGRRTYRTDLLGVIEHHIYHAGQIAILKKACANQARG